MLGSSVRLGQGNGGHRPQVAGGQMLSCQAVMQHQQVLGVHQMRHCGDFVHQVDEMGFPRHTDLQPGVGTETVLNAFHAHIGVEKRPKDPRPAGLAVPLFKGGAPDKANTAAQREGDGALLPMGHHVVPAAEYREHAGEKLFLRAVAFQKVALRIVAPGKDVTAAAHQFPEQGDVLRNFHFCSRSLLIAL